MENKKLVNALTRGLLALVAREVSTPWDITREDLDAHPALRHLSTSEVLTALKEMRNLLENDTQRIAVKLSEQILSGILVDPNDRICACTNPTCCNHLTGISESALLARFPDQRVLDLISPGDTVPLGICPDCKGAIYQPEDEDDVDWSADCDCLDCRQERAYQKQRKAGWSHEEARDRASKLRRQWESAQHKEKPERAAYTEPHRADNVPPVDGCACRWCISKRGSVMGLKPSVVKAVLGSMGDTSDNTGTTKQGSSDHT